MSRTSFLWVAALTVGVVSLAANAQTTPISYGGSIMENFDSIGPAGTALPAGWRAGNLTNAASRVDPPTSGYDSDVLYINDGTLANNARAYSFGTAGSSDRAIGFIPTTSSYGDAGLQVALTNDTGKPIATIVLTYTGEQWRVC